MTNITDADAALSPWDGAAHLDSPEAMAIHLRVAMEEGDTAVIAAALNDIARAQGLADVASRAGVSRTSLYRTLSGTGERLELRTLIALVKAMGLTLSVAAPKH